MGDTVTGGAVKQKVQEEGMVMVRKDLSPKKSFSFLIFRMDLFCPHSLISCGLSVTA